MHKENSPRILTANVESMQAELAVMRQLQEGWPAVAEEYIKPYQNEHPTNFTIRQNKHNFTDFVTPVVDAIAGRVFRTPPTLTNEYSGWANIDQQGHSGNAFLEAGVQEALWFGQYFIFTDFPAADPELSKVERVDRGIRARWVGIPLDNITQVIHSVDASGNPYLSRISWFESVETVDGFLTTSIPQYRSLFNDGFGNITFELWQVDKNGKIAMSQAPTSIIGVTEIPITAINLRELAPLISRPPLIELGHQTINYYQKTSEKDAALALTAHQIQLMTGEFPLDDSGNVLSVGPGAVVHTTDTNAKIQYVGGDTDTPEIFRDELKELREEMGISGMNFLAPSNKVDRETATSQALTVVQDNDYVAEVARAVEQAANKALEFVAQFEDLSTVPTVSFDTALALGPGEGTNLTDDVEATAQETEPNIMTETQ